MKNVHTKIFAIGKNFVFAHFRLISDLKNIIRVTIFFFIAALVVGCGLFGGRSSERTPLPTFTPTPMALDNANSVEGLVRSSNQNGQESELIVVTQEQEPVLTLTPLSTMTPVPTMTQPSLPTATQPTIIPQEPTATDTVLPTIPPEPTASPTPTVVPKMLFDLEDYTKFPTVSLSQNVVRIYLYVYSIDSPALDGYSLLVRYNDVVLPVDGESVGGLPNQTRDTPGPYSRFTNFDTIFVGAQAGTWLVQLIDSQGVVVGPTAQFELTAEEESRELYVRYLQKAEE